VLGCVGGRGLGGLYAVHARLVASGERRRRKWDGRRLAVGSAVE
jgi:hypothetical protein